jgi:antitoxin component YwqK of YwqJK toxin-antitoxin module
MFKNAVVQLLFLSIAWSSTTAQEVAFSTSDDDDGEITLDLVQQLIDSGEFHNELKHDFWVDYSFSAFMLKRRMKINFDSLVFYDSTQRYLYFYREYGMYERGKRSGQWHTSVYYKKRLPLKWIPHSVVEYQEGQRAGKELVFSTEGRVIQENHYKDGQLDGVSTHYTGDGQVKSHISFKSGKFHGESVFYHPDGTLFMRVMYDEGKIASTTFYDRNGDLKKTGYHEVFNENKSLISASNYNQEGQLHGWHRTYYPNGKIEKEIYYEEGLPHGEARLFFTSGQLQQQLQYKGGKIWKVISCFSRTGKPLEAGSLNNGTGTLLIYSDNGKLLREEHYVNGNRMVFSKDQ